MISHYQVKFIHIIINMERNEQLKQYRTSTGLTQSEFAGLLGYTREMMSKVESGKLPVSDDLWLRFDALKRENTSLLNESSVAYLTKRRALKLEKGPSRIPFYDADATAGIAEIDMSPIQAPSGAIDIGDLLKDSTSAIRIYGNSMLPNYPPGCVVGLLMCDKSFIEPGEVYVIETKDRRLLKRLFYPNDDPDSDYLYLYSDNTMKFEGGARDGKLAYPPFKVHKKEILRLFVVTGVIKRNTNSIIIDR